MNMEVSGIDRLLAPPLDRELKRYTVLAYAQRMQERFTSRRLYPYLDVLGQCVQELRSWGEQRDRMDAGMPKELIAIDLKRLRFSYSSGAEKPDALSMIDETIALALPELTRTLGTGNELRSELLDGIQFTPVGVMPLYANEGYLMLRQGSEARVYTYALHRVFAGMEGSAHMNLTTRFVSTYTIGLASTYEQIKRELTRAFAWPNPAAFAFEAQKPLPPVETFLPLAKQLVYAELVRNVA